MRRVQSMLLRLLLISGFLVFVILLPNIRSTEMVFIDIVNGQDKTSMFVGPFQYKSETTSSEFSLLVGSYGLTKEPEWRLGQRNEIRLFTKRWRTLEPAHSYMAMNKYAILVKLGDIENVEQGITTIREYARQGRGRELDQLVENYRIGNLKSTR